MLDDLFVLILAHLLVIILMRCRCVSKAFRDLIDSRFFANMHLHHSMRSRSNRNILCRSTDRESRVSLQCVDIDTLQTFVPKCPGRCWDTCTKFIGTCNGVVAFYNRKFKEITLWNPAIRTYIDVNLPHFSIPRGSRSNYRRNLGFGYDHVNDDYKVVMSLHWYYNTAEYNRGDTNNNQVHVYSLKSNSWRRIGDFPYTLRIIFWPATYANGALYWVCVEKNDDYNFREFIVAFDLAIEDGYRVVPTLPAYDDTGCTLGIYMGSMEGSLCVNCYLCPVVRGAEDDFVKIADTWLLVQRDGEEDTWTKLASYNRPIDICKPLVYSKCGNNLLLRSDSKFFWYDLLKEEVREEFNIRGQPDYFELDVCLESLVHLDGGGSDDENQLVREKKVVED